MPCRKRSEHEQLKRNVERDETIGISLVAFLVGCILIAGYCQGAIQ